MFGCNRFDSLLKNLSNYYAYEVLNVLHFITKLQNFWHIYFKPISEVE